MYFLLCFVFVSFAAVLVARAQESMGKTDVAANCARPTFNTNFTFDIEPEEDEELFEADADPNLPPSAAKIAASASKLEVLIELRSRQPLSEDAPTTPAPPGGSGGDEDEDDEQWDPVLGMAIVRLADYCDQQKRTVRMCKLSDS